MMILMMMMRMMMMMTMMMIINDDDDNDDDDGDGDDNENVGFTSFLGGFANTLGESLAAPLVPPFPGSFVTLGESLAASLVALPTHLKYLKELFLNQVDLKELLNIKQGRFK